MVINVLTQERKRQKTRAGKMALEGDQNAKEDR